MAEHERRCPMCDRAVQLKIVDEELKLFDHNGSSHKCKEKKPIGDVVCGRLVENFQIQNHTLVIGLDGGVELVAWVPGRRLWLEVKTPEGTFRD